ncbi:MAG: phosphoribosylanthranilate isomerase [Gemmatimonadetes bacterium]|nr:phosphoribosylanthranilate isomerase [Gemmatimonadota bacterium]
MTEVKFCGLTRPADAARAAALGAAYVGVIFAGGHRRVDAAHARLVLDAATAATPAPRRVGVFGVQSADEILELAAAARLDVLQLHGASDAALVRDLRQRFAGEVWRVVRVAPDAEPALLARVSDGVDAVLVDALVDGALGGTGVAVDWSRLARLLERAGRPARLVLAGGLRPENVEQAIGLVAPDVVDVSSGVESSPGIKDQLRMRAFAESAARGGQ